MGRHWSSYRGARRNACRGGFRYEADGRKVYEPSEWNSWQPAELDRKRPAISRRLYDKVVSVFHLMNKRGRQHRHLRQIERQGRNNPTAARITVAELDARVNIP